MDLFPAIPFLSIDQISIHLVPDQDTWQTIELSKHPVLMKLHLLIGQVFWKKNLKAGCSFRILVLTTASKLPI